MRKLLFMLISASLFSPVNAQIWKQRRIEAYIGPGVMSEGIKKGKLKTISFIRNGFNITSGVRYRINDDFSSRLSLTAGSFRTNVMMKSNGVELSSAKTGFLEYLLAGEYYFIKTGGENSYLFSRGGASPASPGFARTGFYVFAGVGGTSYKTNINFSLEKGKRGFMIIIPAGIGLNNSFSPGLKLGIELAGRYAINDYPEGFSIYSPDHMFMLLNFHFIYRITVRKEKN
jgi:hypothetical protein